MYCSKNDVELPLQCSPLATAPFYTSFYTSILSGVRCATLPIPLLCETTSMYQKTPRYSLSHRYGLLFIFLHIPNVCLIPSCVSSNACKVSRKVAWYTYIHTYSTRVPSTKALRCLYRQMLMSVIFYLTRAYFAG